MTGTRPLWWCRVCGRSIPDIEVVDIVAAPDLILRKHYVDTRGGPVPHILEVREVTDYRLPQ